MTRTPSSPRLTRFLPAVFQLEDRCTPAAIVVNSMNDTVAVDGVVTLREAIQSVNAGASVNADVTATGYGTGDAITFDTSVFNGVFGTITLTSDLDPITRPVVIDGPTAPGGFGFILPLVTVDGNNNNTFVIQASGVTLRDLSVVDSATHGVRLDAGVTNTQLTGNYIGIRADGLTGEGNRTSGVFIGAGAANNRIGGGTFADRNVISGNSTGVILDGAGTTANVLDGNFIGTDRNGISGTGLANNIGVWVRNGASNNTIGGTERTDFFFNSLIRNSLTYGVLVSGAGTDGTVIIGSSIGGLRIEAGATNTRVGGTTVGERNSAGSVVVTGAGTTGTSFAGNTISGLSIEGGATNTRVGGSAAERNVFTGNTTGHGLRVLGPGTDNTLISNNFFSLNSIGLLVQGGSTNTAVRDNLFYLNTDAGLALVDQDYFVSITGNFIGTSFGGGGAAGNAVGVRLSGGTANITVGGTTAADRNVISGNSIGVQITGAGTTSNVVAGNYIGTNAAGTVAIPNRVGVEVTGGASGNTVGGSATGAGNLISGNSQFGVRVSGASTTGTVIAGNFIGRTTGFLSGVGVRVSDGAENTVIGGNVVGTANEIAFNRLAGVLVTDTAGGVNVLGNSIHSNTGLGIDLSATTTPDGVTANDLGDTDAGGNGRQNFPVITSVVGTNVAGVLRGSPNRTILVELFADDARHPSGFGQGRRLLGSTTVSTDVSGAGSFTFTAPSSLTGQFVSATATDITFASNTSTSEFSNAVLGLTTTTPLIPALTPPLTPPSTASAPPLTQFGGLVLPTTGAAQALGPKSVLVAGGSSVVVVFNPDGTERGRIDAFPGFRGGVRVATADVTGDGHPDILAAAGPGGGPHVKVFDGVTGAEIRSFFAYDASFRGGVWVAGGDLNGDGRAEIITGAGFGGSPHVRVFDGQTLAPTIGFYAYAPTFSGGVTVAAGDFDGDGLADIITGAGAGGAPHVRVFSAAVQPGLNPDGTIFDERIVKASFYAYSPLFTGGVFVSSGADFDGDGRMDIVTGVGPGGAPHVKVIAASLAVAGGDGTVPDSSLLGSFYAFEETIGVEARVSVANVDQNGDMEVVVGPAAGIAPQSRVLRVLRANGVPAVADVSASDPTFNGGVFVG